MITVTFIRHGQSEDNPKGIWAGWKDAPLSNLGKRQAQALAHSLSTTRITHIYASDLLRAHHTAQAVYSKQPEPKPSFTVTPNVREQHFGAAEGNRWIPHIPEGMTKEELYAQDLYPWVILNDRQERFPNGESLEDLARRAETAIRDCILPHLPSSSEPEEIDGSGVHVAVASHGLCIGELISALLRLDPEAKSNDSYTGLLNTAWTRVNVLVRDGHQGPVDPQRPPPLKVSVTHINYAEHLESVSTTVLKEAEDETHAEARAFFGGMTNTTPATTSEVAN